MESGEGTDHEDTGTETSPETTETDLGVDGSNGRLSLSRFQRSIEFGDHSIGGVRDNGAEDSCDVSTQVREKEGQLRFIL